MTTAAIIPTLVTDQAQPVVEAAALVALPAAQFDALGFDAPQLSLDQWREFGREIGSNMRRAAFAIGDWLLYAEERAGQLDFWGAVASDQVSRKVYDEAVALTGIDITTLQNYAYVARHVPRPIRSERVSWEHHKKVAKLKDAGEKTSWLAVVAKGNKSGDRISSRRLARSIVAGRLVTRDEMETRDSDRGLENVNPYVNRIVVFVGKLRAAGWIESADAHKLRALARDLQPVADIVNELTAAANAHTAHAFA